MLNLPATVFRARAISYALLLTTCIFCLSSLPLFAQGQSENTLDNTGSALADEFINIHFAPEASAAERLTVIKEMGGELNGWIEALHIARIQITLPIKAQTRGLAVERTSTSAESVALVESDLIVQGVYMPNDPAVADPVRTYNLRITETLDAWDIEQGSADVVVAVVDTGVSMEHPEFSGRLLPGYDFVNNDSEPADDHGHGTHVAGIVAGAIDNNLGVGGVCPRCSILPVKVLDSRNIGTWFTAAQGIVYAVDKGAKVINLSLGAATPSSTIEIAIRYAQSKGVLIIAAAGNAGSDQPFYPAAYESVLSVGATGSDDQLWNISNYGDTIDVTAPGHFIFNAAPELDNEYGGFTYKSGTSMASPHVAGLVGLLLSQDSTRDIDLLKKIIFTTSDDLGESGWDRTYGYGRINVLSSLLYGRSLMSGDDANQVAASAPQNLNQNIEGGGQDDSLSLLFLPLALGQ